MDRKKQNYVYDRRTTKDLPNVMTMGGRSVKSYVDQDKLGIREKVTKYRLEAHCVGHNMAVDLLKKGKLVTVDDIKKFAEMVAAVMFAYTAIKPFRDALRKAATAWLDMGKIEIEKVPGIKKVEEYKSWMLLDGPKNGEITYLVVLPGVTHINHMVTEFVDNTGLVVRGGAYTKEDGLLDVEVTINLPQGFDYKDAQVRKEFDGGLIKVWVEGFHPK